MAAMFGPKRVFIRPAESPEAEWKELKTVISDSISFSGDDSPMDIVRWKPITLSFSVRVGKKTTIRLLQAFGFLKAPRCTYKTIKRNCAKRNKYKR